MNREGRVREEGRGFPGRGVAWGWGQGAGGEREDDMFYEAKVERSV